MTTPRTPLRNDDISEPRDMQRPLNEAIRGLAADLAAQPRRQQAWVFFEAVAGTVANALVRTPEYPIAGILVLQTLRADGSAGGGLSAAPFISWESAEGQPNVVKVFAGFGLPTVPFHALVEFVEDVTGGLNAANPSGGVP